MADSVVPDLNAPLAANSTLFHSPRTFIHKRIQRSGYLRGGGGLDNPLPHGKAQSCKFPQEYWKAQSYQCQVIIGPLAMHHLNDVSLAGRWWLVLVAGYRFHRNTGTDPRPILKKI